VGNEHVPRRRRGRRPLSVLALSGTLAALVLGTTPLSVAAAPAPSYQNPLKVRTANGTYVQSCADPTVIRGQRAQDRPAGSPMNHRYWYMYCTKDPLHDQDRTGGNYNFQNIPMFRSADLVNWTYMGNVFGKADAPGTNYPNSWLPDGIGLFAPEIQYYNGKYYLYYSATDTKSGGSAIGVATSNGPLGPWTDKGSPVVEPVVHGCCGDAKRATIDPEVVTVGTQKYMFFGSYFGGVFARDLDASGFDTDPASEVRIAVDNRYEGPEIVKRGAYYYLFMSMTDCCRGRLTGYSVVVARSTNILGPYVDHDGQPVLDDRPGGFIALSMNGNRWVGPGHNTVFTDVSGKHWTIYHAVNRFKPYYKDGVDLFNADPFTCVLQGEDPATAQPCGDLTQRPALMDPVDWQGATATDPGWPNVRSGRWASDAGNRIPGPAAQPGQTTSYRPQGHWNSGPGNLRPNYSDEFNGALKSQWSWIREPDGAEFGVEGGEFRFETQDAELFVDSDNAPVLVENAPPGDYVVEVKFRMNMPTDENPGGLGACIPGCRFTQGGIVIRAPGAEGDDKYVKLVEVAIFNTRQIEWAREETDAEAPSGFPRYGNSAVGPPSPQNEYQWIRIIKTAQLGKEFYKAFSSTDGQVWYRGGTWTHELGAGQQIGLISMGGPDFTTRFDYVRVYDLKVVPPGS
jgi:arabinan endo-1,5-alpha-L-arabinosidase